jgi:hypothetical protein
VQQRPQHIHRRVHTFQTITRNAGQDALLVRCEIGRGYRNDAGLIHGS